MNTHLSGTEVVAEMMRKRKVDRWILNRVSNPPVLEKGLKTHYRIRALT